MLETVPDKVVATDHSYEVIYGLSNRGNSNDLESLARLLLTARFSNVIFLPARRYVSAVPDVIVCLSVRRSVCHTE